MRKVALIIAGAVTILMLLVAFIGGIFDFVSFSVQKVGPYNLVYKENKGSYTGIRLILNDVFRYVVKEKKGKVLQGFAIFYDDPSKVPTDSLRYIAGVITDSLHQVSNPYKSVVYPQTDAVVGQFPIRSFLSYTSGTYKFYNELKKYVAKNDLKISGSVLEIYDSAKRQITYVVALDSNNQAPEPKFGQ